MQSELQTGVFEVEAGPSGERPPPREQPTSNFPHMKYQGLLISMTSHIKLRCKGMDS